MEAFTIGVFFRKVSWFKVLVTYKLVHRRDTRDQQEIGNLVLLLQGPHDQNINTQDYLLTTEYICDKWNFYPQILQIT